MNKHAMQLILPFSVYPHRHAQAKIAASVVLLPGKNIPLLTIINGTSSLNLESTSFSHIFRVMTDQRSSPIL